MTKYFFCLTQQVNYQSLILKQDKLRFVHGNIKLVYNSIQSRTRLKSIQIRHFELFILLFKYYTSELISLLNSSM